LELVGLSGSLNKLPKQLSGGMKQRAAIAQVFAINPPVLLMDEPFGALDAINRVHLQDILLTLWGQNKSDRKTIIFVTHDVDEALLLSNKVIVFTLNPEGYGLLYLLICPGPGIGQNYIQARSFTN